MTPTGPPASAASRSRGTQPLAFDRPARMGAWGAPGAGHRGRHAVEYPWTGGSAVTTHNSGPSDPAKRKYNRLWPARGEPRASRPTRVSFLGAVHLIRIALPDLQRTRTAARAPASTANSWPTTPPRSCRGAPTAPTPAPSSAGCPTSASNAPPTAGRRRYAPSATPSSTLSEPYCG